MTTPAHENQIRSLIDKGQFMPTLVTLMERAQFSSVAACLQAYRSILHRENYNYESEIAINETRQAYDVMVETFHRLGDTDKLVFLALCYSNISSQISTYTRADFTKYFVDPCTGKAKDRFRHEYDGLSTHPLSILQRDGLRYLPREKALDVLAGLWSTHQRSAFLYMHDVLLPLQNDAQRAHDPKWEEESFSDGIAMHPGLEIIVETVTRGTGPEGSTGLNEVPTMRLIVSNAVKPLDFDAQAKEGWQQGEDLDPEMWIVTAGKVYNNLKDYLGAALKTRRASKGFGPYRFYSNADTTYATAANLLACIHSYLHVSKNFEAPAQNRLREQLKSIETTAFGKIYAWRYLRAQKWPVWAAALTLRNESKAAADSIGFYDASKALVLYGFTHAGDYFDHRIKDQNDARQIYLGFKDGVIELFESMKELATPDDRIDKALYAYESERGFHTDILMLAVSERKKLAFKDLGDILLANLTGQRMLAVFQEKESDEDDKLEKEIMLQIPLREIADLYLQAGDVTNTMRLYEYAKAISKSGEFSLYLEQKIKKSGYHVMDEMTIRDLKSLPFRAVFNDDGLLWIRTKPMTEFQTVDQLIEAHDLSNAVAAYITLQGMNFSEALAGSKKEQMEKLHDFMSQEVIAAEILRQPEKLGLEAEDTGAYINFLRSVLPHFLAEEAMRDTAANVEKSGKILTGAFDQAASAKRRPLYQFAVDAARSVAGFLPGKKGRSPF